MISSIFFMPGQLRWTTGRSPAIQAVVRSPSTRLRAPSDVPLRLVESTAAVSRFFGPEAERSSSSSRAPPGTATARADTWYSPDSSVLNRRCSPTSADAGDKPPASVPRCREYTVAAASVRAASAGSTSMRVTCTSGTDTSENPAPERPGRACCAARTVIFIQEASPTGALTVCGRPFVFKGLSAEPRSVSIRTCVGAARMASPGRGVSWREAGMSVGWEKSTRSHCPTGSPGLPSAHAVSGLPSKAFTGSYCGRWNSQLPLLEAVTDAAPRSTAVVWCSVPSDGRICLGFSPGFCRLPE